MEGDNRALFVDDWVAEPRIMPAHKAALSRRVALPRGRRGEYIFVCLLLVCVCVWEQAMKSRFFTFLHCACVLSSLSPLPSLPHAHHASTTKQQQRPLDDRQYPGGQRKHLPILLGFTPLTIFTGYPFIQHQQHNDGDAEQGVILCRNIHNSSPFLIYGKVTMLNNISEIQKLYELHA